MGTLKACLAVANDITEADFDDIERRAKEYAGDKPLATSHFIKAASDIVATLKADIKAIESSAEADKPAATPAPAPAAAPAPATSQAKDEDAAVNALTDVLYEKARIRQAGAQWGQYAPKGVKFASLPAEAQKQWADAVEANKPNIALAEELAAKVSTDLAANLPESVADQRKRAEARLDNLLKRDTTLDYADEARIRAAIEKGDFDLANSIMAEISTAMRELRYRDRETDTPPAKPISRALLDSLTEAVGKALGGRVTVVVMDSVTDLDPSQKPGTRAGAMIKDTVYLFRDGIADGMEGQRTIFHELFHKGLRRLLPDATYREVLSALYQADADVRRMADAWQKQHQDDVDSYAVDLRKRNPDLTAEQHEQGVQAFIVDEVLASKGENTPLKPSLANRLRELMAKVADAIGMKELAKDIRDMGLKPAERLIRDALRASLDGMAAPVQTGTDSTIQFRTAAQAISGMADVMRYDVFGKARRAVLSSSFLRDIQERFGSKLAGVDEYTNGTFAMSAAAAEIQEKANEVNDNLNALAKKEREEVLDLMTEATYAKVVIEPTEGKTNAHLMRIEGTGDDARQVMDPIVAELQGRFNRMSEAQKTAYRSARDELAALWKKRGELLARTANEIYRPLIEQAQREGNEDSVKELERQLRQFLSDTNRQLSQIQGDYFPLQRFGDYVVVKKSEQFEALQQQVDQAYAELEGLYRRYEHHTPAQRKEIAKINKARKARGEEVIGEFTEEEEAEIKEARKTYNELQSKLEGMKASEADYYMTQFEAESDARAHAKEIGGKVSLKKEHLRELNPITRTMLNRLEDSVAAGLRARGMTTALRDAKRAMYEVFLQTLPERSALMRQAKRKNVAGAREMQRSIISSMLRDSFYLSRMEHSEKITGAINQMYGEAEDSGELALQEVQRELARRYAASLTQTDTPVQDMAAAMTYIYKLGISPGFLIANGIQPFTVSIPVMAARHGAKAATSFASAWGATAKVVSQSLGENYRRGEIRFDNVGLPADEVAMLKKMLDQRLLSVTLVGDLARTADGKATSQAASLLAKPSHFVEVVNRMSTALAAYRLEKAKSGTDAAEKYAAKVLADTHLDYSTENAPYWMKPGVLPFNKLVFQFKKYQAGMISLFAKTVSAAAKGETPAVRAEARRALLGLFATHAAIGGVLGMPAVGTLMFIANLIAKAFGDDDGEPFDAETELRNWLADNFGVEAARVVAKGMPTLIGMDLSQKVGLGDLLNPMPTVRADKSGRDLALEVMASSLGPFFGGIVPQFFDAASYFAKGDFIKGTEQILPKFIADAVKAARFADEGITTRQGVTATPAESLSAWDIALQGIGVPSANIRDTYEARAAQENVMSGLRSAAGTVKKDWVEAMQEGDQQKAQEVWGRIREEINPARVRNGLKPITMSELMKFRTQRGKEEAKYQRLGGNTNPKLAQVSRFARPQ